MLIPRGRGHPTLTVVNAALTPKINGAPLEPLPPPFLRRKEEEEGDEEEREGEE